MKTKIRKAKKEDYKVVLLEKNFIFKV